MDKYALVDALNNAAREAIVDATGSIPVRLRTAHGSYRVESVEYGVETNILYINAEESK